MKRFDLINRRAHLYLGLFLLPWLTMYGVSSFLISHHAWFRSDQPPNWQPVFERPYQRPAPADADLREVAHEILKDCQMEGAFWAQRPKADEIRINRFRFWDETRLIYSVKEKRLRAERQLIRWDQVVLRMHFRGGFQQPTFLDDLWAILVDVVCLGIVAWIGTGLVMWWRLARLRLAGALAVMGGVLSFLFFVWRL